MNSEDKKFEKLKVFLWNRPCYFCIIYRSKRSESGIELKWCKAVSLNFKSHEEYDNLAAKYQEIAADCYRRTRSIILEENLPDPNSQGERWCGFDLHVGPAHPHPANKLGQRWWHIVIGSGATYKAGYVIVARVAAKDEMELCDCVVEIQRIMAS